MTNEEAKKDKNNSNKPATIEPDDKNSILKRRIEFQNENKKNGVLLQSDSPDKNVELKDYSEIQKLINRLKTEIEQAQNRKLNVDTIEQAIELDNIIHKNQEELRDLLQKLK